MLRKNTFLLAIVASLMMLIVNTANADLVWSTVPPERFETSGSVSLAHNNSGADFVANPQVKGGYFEVEGSDLLGYRFEITLDANKFVKEDVNYLVFQIGPNLVNDYITALDNIYLFGEKAQSISLTEAAKSGITFGSNGAGFYFNTNTLFAEATENGGDVTIAFDVLLKGDDEAAALANAWTIDIEAGYVKEESEGGTPEPATMLIFGLGIAGLGLARRRMVK